MYDFIYAVVYFFLGISFIAKPVAALLFLLLLVAPIAIVIVLADHYLGQF
jgi:hypothetical protein